jgi:hypothetical protein
MKSRVLAIVVASLALSVSLGARASSVSLVPSTTNVLQNGTFTVDLMLSAADAIGGHPGDYVGKVTLDFDPLKLAYQGFAFTSPVTQYMAVSTGTAGARQTVSLGFAEATDNSKIGVFTFQALSSLGSTNLGVADYDDFIHTFFNTTPTNQRFYPNFNGTSVNISAVPLPATAWLLATGFGLVGIRQRFGHKARTAT